MAPGTGPTNLKQKRNCVSRTDIKGILAKENGMKGQRGATTHKSIGGARITNKQNTKSQTVPSHITIERDNTALDLAAETSQIQSQASEIPRQEASQIPSTESIQNASSEDVDAPTVAGSKKRTRGPTTGKGILKYFDHFKSKMKIDVDTSIGRPKTVVQSAKLSSQIGVITRDVLPVPKQWKDVDEVNGLEPGFDHLQIHMDVNIDKPGVKHCLVERIKNTTRQKRYHLHSHFRKFATLQEVKSNKPTFCPSQDNWEDLCDYFASEKYKRRCEVNRENRKKLRCKHISGRKAFTVRGHEISAQELDGNPCDRIDLYERTHRSEKDGWKSNEAKENWEIMKKKREEYIELGIEKSADEIVFEVLGHGTGYVKGLGYGPKPPSRRKVVYDPSSPLEEELNHTKEKLQESEAQVQELKTQLTSLNANMIEQDAKMAAQGATLEKVMSFLAEKGINL